MVGTLSVSNDLDFVMTILNNDFDKVYKVIVLDQDGEFPVPLGGPVLGGSVLLPPYDILSMFMDGNAQGFRGKYYEYLEFNPQAREYIATIMASLYLGNQIILYIKPDLVTEFPVQEVILNYLWNRYFISPAMPGVPFMVHNMDMIIAECYKLGVIDGWTYLSNYNGPIGVQNELAILMNEFQPYMNPNPTAQDVVNYFEGLRYTLRSSGKQELIMPITRKRG